MLKYSFHYHQTQCLSFMPERSTLASALIHQQHIHPTVVLVTLESETDSNVLLKKMLFFFLNYLFGRNLYFVLGNVSNRIHVFHKKSVPITYKKKKIINKKTLHTIQHLIVFIILTFLLCIILIIVYWYTVYIFFSFY